jgi:hypothetical protein
MHILELLKLLKLLNLLNLLEYKGFADDAGVDFTSIR